MSKWLSSHNTINSQPMISPRLLPGPFLSGDNISFTSRNLYRSSEIPPDSNFRQITKSSSYCDSISPLTITTVGTNIKKTNK